MQTILPLAAVSVAAMRIRNDIVRFGALALLLLTACSGGGGGGAGTDHSQHQATPAEEEVAFGQPGGSGGRTITVDMGDYFFKPQLISVKPGETVTFSAENIGEQPHQLVIGDLEYHEQHAGGGGTHLHQSGTGVASRGDSVEVTWTFPDEPMDLLIACHVEDHYARGMIGTLKVE